MERSFGRTRADRVGIIRLETRARESVGVARVRRQSRRRRETNKPAALSGQGRRVISA